MGRVVSFVNTNIIPVDYWEKRFVGFIFLFASLLAPIPLIKFRDHLRDTTRKIFADVSIIALLCLVVISGYSTMVLQSEYWFTRVNGDGAKISAKEFQAINHLKSLLQEDKYAFTISPSIQSRDIVAFAAPAYQFSEPQVLVSSSYPEIGLLTLASHNLDHAVPLHASEGFQNNTSKSTWLAC